MSSDQVQIKTIRFSVSESANYRRIYADGAAGGFQKNDGFVLTFYNERPSFPADAYREIEYDGDKATLGDEQDDAKPTEMNLDRTHEVSVFMTTQTAMQLRDFLVEVLPKPDKSEAEPKAGE